MSPDVSMPICKSVPSEIYVPGSRYAIRFRESWSLNEKSYLFPEYTDRESVYRAGSSLFTVVLRMSSAKLYIDPFPTNDPSANEELSLILYISSFEWDETSMSPISCFPRLFSDWLREFFFSGRAGLFLPERFSLCRNINSLTFMQISDTIFICTKLLIL